MKKILSIAFCSLIQLTAFAAPPAPAHTISNTAQTISANQKENIATMIQGQENQLQNNTAKLNQLNKQLKTQSNLLSVQCPTQPYNPSCQQLANQVQALQKQNEQLKNSINQKQAQLKQMRQQQVQQTSN